MAKLSMSPQEVSHSERIVAAAAAEFLRHGYQQASTAAIVRSARVSKRELYANFPDKRALLAAVIVKMQLDMQAGMDLRWTSEGELRTTLLEAATRIQAFFSTESFGALFRVVAAESVRDPELGRRFLDLGPRRGRKSTAAYFSRQMDKGTMRRADPLTAADDFLDIVVSAGRLAAIAMNNTPSAARGRKHVEHAVDIFLRIYGVAGGTPSVRRKKSSTMPKMDS